MIYDGVGLVDHTSPARRHRPPPRPPRAAAAAAAAASFRCATVVAYISRRPEILIRRSSERNATGAARRLTYGWEMLTVTRDVPATFDTSYLCPSKTW